jgi:hypothetical protein
MYLESFLPENAHLLLKRSEGSLSGSLGLFGTLIKHLNEVIFFLFAEGEGPFSYGADFVNQFVAQFFLESKHVVFGKKLIDFVCGDAFECRINTEEVGKFRAFLSIEGYPTLRVCLRLPDFLSYDLWLIY